MPSTIGADVMAAMPVNDSLKRVSVTVCLPACIGARLLLQIDL